MTKMAGGDRLGLALASALLLAGLAATSVLAQPAGLTMTFQKPGPWPTTPAPLAAAKFEGVWKLVEPTTTLKPVSGAVPFTAEGKARYAENKKLKTRRWPRGRT